jgi:hypothetical protein
MPELNELECKIYVDADGTKGELAKRIAELLSAPVEGTTISTRCGEIDVQRNDDFDEKRRLEFPDGFLYFRFLVELYTDDSATPRCGPVVVQILEYFWAQGLPAVAACDYEDDLPNGGGYKSTAIPWPVLN